MLRKLLLYTILPCLACVACTHIENESAAEADTGDLSVRFAFGAASPAVSSRAAVTTTATFDRMGIFGYSHDITTGWTGTAATSLLPDYFLNKMVWRNVGETWQYDGVVKYWPDPARSVSFFAYAPYIDNQRTFVVAPKTETESGSPTITYTVPTNIAEQVDLLYDSQFNQTYTAASGGTGLVRFNMNHALSQVDVSMRLDPDDIPVAPPVTVEITAVRLVNIRNSGILTLANTTTPWAVNSSMVTYDLSAANGLDATHLSFDSDADDPTSADYAFDYRQLNAEPNGHLMLLPQTLSSTPGSEAKLEIDYTLHGATDKSVRRTYDLASQTWEAGNRYNYQLTISLTEPVELLPAGTNCYMVHPAAGEVTMNIPLLRINEYWNGTAAGYGNNPTVISDGEWTAEILWTDLGNNITAANLTKAAGSKGVKDYFTVKIPAGCPNGNFVVAVRNSNGDILWSWHIWVTDYDPDEYVREANGTLGTGTAATYGVTGGQVESYAGDVWQTGGLLNGMVMMDRALGAIERGTTATTTTRGLLYYQFGRKDPFPASIDGEYPVTLGSTTLFTISDNFNAVYIADAVKDPTKFYKANGTDETRNDNWCKDTGLSDDLTILWNDDKAAVSDHKKSIYDPCPAGWRLPEIASDSDNASPWYGFTPSGKEGSTITTYAYAAAGRRMNESGALNSVGTIGYYWSATPNSIPYGRYMSCNSGRVYMKFNNYRAFGYSVRCSQYEEEERAITLSVAN